MPFAIVAQLNCITWVARRGVVTYDLVAWPSGIGRHFLTLESYMYLYPVSTLAFTGTAVTEG